ncbi:MAG: LysR family transcriptional regulator [Gammaproteobacteria bacterium]|nr:LysR family transcriptional regulator [Gammaproteobacteria bacterium]MCY4228368.1 LysR family transcriptional regulator [Gammaproteobacteria bacterium]MCY4313445.1 LysR family transcriptional regulator [Gammaproteobacteria bacterium]
MKPKAASYYKQNRLKQLRAFCHTARSGSISKAATKLYLSQPSVSLQIQALERELNTILFERRGPKISLTPDGKELLDIALPMVEGMDSLRDTFASRSGNLNSGYINIAAGESTILYMLPKTIKSFSRQYPGVRIRLHNVNGVDGLAMLRADDADFAVGSLLEVPDDMNYFPICRFTPTLITPINHPLAGKERVRLEEIAAYSLILPPRYLSTWNIVISTFQRHNIKHNVSLETGGWEVIKRYVELGIGISIVTDICLEKKDRLGVIPVGEHFAPRNYGIILRRGKFISAQASRFIETLSPEFFRRSGHVQDPASFRSSHDSN